MALFYFKHVLFLCYFKTDIYDIEQQLQLGALVHLVQVDLGVDLLVPASHVVLVQPPEKKKNNSNKSSSRNIWEIACFFLTVSNA